MEQCASEFDALRNPFRKLSDLLLKRRDIVVPATPSVETTTWEDECPPEGGSPLVFHRGCRLPLPGGLETNDAPASFVVFLTETPLKKRVRSPLRFAVRLLWRTSARQRRVPARTCRRAPDSSRAASSPFHSQ